MSTNKWNRISRQSTRAKKEMTLWLKIKKQRIQQLIDKFGYLPCEYCKERIIDGSDSKHAEAHHNDHNRRNNTFSNCRILHAFCNRVTVEENNIKDVPSLLED